MVGLFWVQVTRGAVTVQAPLVVVAVMLPKVAASMLALGFANSGLFQTLNASARTVKRIRSVSAKLLCSERSVLKRCGPRRMLRPALP